MKEIKIKKNVLSLKESATLAINQTAKGMKFSGKQVYHWGFGQSPFPVPMPIQIELKEKSGHKDYLPTQGLLGLRETLSKYYHRTYKLNFSPEQIFIGPGSKELIFQLLYLLEGETIIPAPSWVSYGPQVELKEKKPHIITTKRENNYKLTPVELEICCNQLGDVQKTLILNSPSNPTGQLYNDAELREISVVLKKHEVIVISDEIYSQVNFENKNTPSLSTYYPEGTIITGGLSKAHSAGGYRLGYAIIPTGLNAIIKPLKAMISETFSAVATPVQYAAIKAWDDTTEVNEEILLCSEIHKACAKYFYKRLLAMKVDSPNPMGAFYLFISFAQYRDKFKKRGIESCQDLCNYLLDKYQIALLPGDDFYYPVDSLTARLAFVDYNGFEVLEIAKEVKNIDHNFVETHITQLKAGLDQLEKCLSLL